MNTLLLAQLSNSLGAPVLSVTLRAAAPSAGPGAHLVVGGIEALDDGDDLPGAAPVFGGQGGVPLAIELGGDPARRPGGRGR